MGAFFKGENMDRKNIINKAKTIIVYNEGCELKKYKFGGEKNFTIGYGHVIVKGDGIVTDTITRAKAVELLNSDIDLALDFVIEVVKVPLNDNQLAALTSFVFNGGTTRFKNSTMLKLINKGQVSEASGQFGRWVLGRDKITRRLVRMPGLVKRREQERRLYIS